MVKRTSAQESAQMPDAKHRNVEGDVPLENMLAAVETVQRQPGYAARG